MQEKNKFILRSLIRPLERLEEDGGERDNTARAELNQAISLLEELHPADIADVLEDLEESHSEVVPTILSKMSERTTAQVFAEIDSRIRARGALLRQLGSDKAREVLGEMDADDAADLLQEISDPDARELIDLLDPGERGDLEGLLLHDEETAGGLMTTDFVALNQSLTVDKVLSTLRKRGIEDTEDLYAIYVLDESARLSGVLALPRLLSADPDQSLREIMNPSVIYGTLGQDQEEIGRVLTKYDLMALPIVDEGMKLKGVVTVDDVLDVFDEEATEDFYLQSGITDFDDDYLRTGTAVLLKSRIRWLLVFLALSVFTILVIRGSKDSLIDKATLAFFIPMVLGCAGNAGTQSVTLVVRGIALGRIRPRDFLRVMGKEMLLGLSMGAILGISALLIVNVLSFGESDGSRVAVVVGGTIFLSIIATTTCGGLLPILFRKLGQDPALMSNSMLTTLADVISAGIYFTMARIFFG